jgi:hypothetical protein
MIKLNKPQKRVYMINPHWYIGIFSRGVGKTFYLQAIRSMETAKNVPGGFSCFYNATYIGAQQRTVAGTISGWKSLGWVEGRDFVKNIEPPKHFLANQHYKPFTWKNTVVTKNGHVFIIGSNDRPGLVNSLSITGGIFVDECRFIDEPLMREDLYPAIRGNNIWGDDNPFVFSRTYTSDMPFISDEAEWLFEFEKLMNPDQIKLIAAASIHVEKIKYELFKYNESMMDTDKYSEKIHWMEKIEELNKDLAIANMYLFKIRSSYKGTKGSVYYDTGSFLSNINVLKKNYFFDNFNPQKPLISKVSFLNFKPEEVENKFYTQLAKRHFISGNLNYDILEPLGIADEDNKHNILAAHIYDYNKELPVDIEFDFGDMCTCSISQTFGLEERYIATFEVMFPFDIDDLVDMCNHFLQGHQNKKVYIYKDPAGNWQRNKKQQVYGLETIERFRYHGWNVFDMCPPGSINPEHGAKHQLISWILKEKRPEYPYIRIIRETNRQLEASLKKAPLKIEIKKDGSKMILKDKSSEKLIPLEDKAMKTTDHSDHFDIKLWHKYNHLMPEDNIFL